MQEYAHIRDLFSKYMEGTITPEERNELSETLELYSNTEWERILAPLAEATAPDPAFKLEHWESKLQYILRQPAAPRPKLVSFRWKWMAAAAVLVFVVLGWFLASRESGVDSRESIVGSQESAVIPKVQDIAPGREGAILTLADGRQIILDSAGNGMLTQQGAAEVSKQGNQLVYDQQGKNTEVVYNTMHTPKGRQYQLVLSDGSKVWLNAASSIRFPTAFSGATREVEITGEAYFEVAHNASKPFKVRKGEMEVTVLGTHFNVNAYEDESDIKVTLLEGSVKVSHSTTQPNQPFNHSTILKPGEQAQAAPHSPLTIDHSPDLEQVMAWKNGRFEFNGSTVEMVMRQIARWYDVEVVYEGPKPSVHFMGGISRLENISEVLKMLEQTKAVRYRIEGRRIVVMK